MARSEIEARVMLFWNQELRAIESMPAELSAFKNAELPLARIKKIMKLDDDVKGMMIAAEAPLLFSKAAEIFIRELTIRAWAHTERARRRTLQRNDIAMSVGDPDTDQFDFLIDIVPREEMRPAGHTEGGKQSSSVTAVADQQAHLTQQVQPSEAAVAAPVQYVIQLPVSAAGPANGQAVQIFFNNSTDDDTAAILAAQEQQQQQQLEEPLEQQGACAVDSDALVMDVKPIIAQQDEQGYAEAVETVVASAADTAVAADSSQLVEAPAAPMADGSEAPAATVAETSAEEAEASPPT